MNYVHPILLSNHWIDIISMIEDNYSNCYNQSDILIVGQCVFESVEEIKSRYPGFNRYIVYQLEPLSENHWIKKETIINNIKGADEIWDYDLQNINELKKFGINAKFKPFLYSEKLKRINNSEEPDIDILFYGSITESRAKTITGFSVHGVTYENFVTVTNVDGKKLDEYISRSKVIIDLQTDSENRIQKQSRIYYALINGKCVVSEKSNYNYFGDLIHEAEDYNLIHDPLSFVRDGSWRIRGESASKRFKNISNKLVNCRILDCNDTNIIYDTYEFVQNFI